MSELSKVYEPHEVEERLYRWWEEAGYFGPRPDAPGEAFTIVMPPPNITGALHIGHALDLTLQDVLVRYQRMRGFKALWVPGTDHASIAVHVVIERELAKEGLSRHQLGRAAFLARVWEWQETYGNQIIHQLRRLGSSCDWSRTRFTMDPGLSRAVRKVFVDLFEEGLIYRGARIINWCPRCETALADIELDHAEHEGGLVRFRYPLDGAAGHIAVATTRLETMLGDTAIAVNPEDARYRHLVGGSALHPFLERKLPIVADAAVDPGFGTGAVKVTPAHDPTDFEIAERHGLDKINIFDGRAVVNQGGGRFAGLDRMAAREAVAKALAAKGLLDGTEPHRYTIARCARCGTVTEPWLSEQWFVRMEPLAIPAIEAVKEGRIRFHPERWSKYYLNWMEQIRDWCISRQLWWGHRIPVFYCDTCGEVWAAMEEPRSCRSCASSDLHQDPDILDTWFSSALWPFSTLGWPEETEDLRTFFPTSVLVTGYEIIHLWVARMIMTGLHFMGDVPFRWVYVHGIVRDELGRKMSKSLGNVIDPLKVIEGYGCDALRFTLAEHATGQDIFLNEQWITGGRNFANKLWNVARFVLMSLGEEAPAQELPPPERRSLADRWVLSRLARTASEVTSGLEGFEIAQAARALHSFLWSEYADWYIEAAKLRVAGEDEAAKTSSRAALAWIFDHILRLLHPFMPFITEEIYRLLPGPRGPSIMQSPWPAIPEELLDPTAEEAFGRVQEAVSALRSFRADHRVDPKVRLSVAVDAADPSLLAPLQEERRTVMALARLAELRVTGAEEVDPPVVRLAGGGVDLLVSLRGVLDDLEAEQRRLARELEQIQDGVERLERRVGSPEFRAKAHPEVVARNERRLEESLQRAAALAAQIARLGGSQ